MKRILAILIALTMLLGMMPIYAHAESECEHEYFTPCDGVCMNCGEVTRESTHEMTLIPGVEAVDCQTPGTLEHYKCSKCNGTYYDEEGLRALNPWFIEVTIDCVRPEGAADCATVPCEVCGNDTYGYGEHDLGDSFVCQGGTCLKCGEKVTGYGCENDGPYCLDGHCIFCGEVVEGWGHENGAWAACIDGLCAYGCGLEYPATAEHNDADGNGICDVCYFCAGDHNFENGFDPCYGGTCSRCWAYFEGEHTYDVACDVDCNVCGENREVEHNVVHVPAVAGSCIETGNLEYWYCLSCGSVWLDEDCTFPSNLKAVILGGPSHPELLHFEAKEPTCFEDGNIEYWYCELCGWAFIDEYGFDYIKLEETVIPAAHTFANSCDVDCNVCGENREVEHNVIHVEAVKPTCKETGNIEYWYCDVCGSAWLDAECTLNTNIMAVITPIPGPVFEMIHVEAKDPTCTEDGNVEYWYCESCGDLYLDEEGTLPTTLEEVTVPAAHTFANPCDTYCVVCEEDVRDPAHSLTYVARVEPVDCQTPGNIEHWYCEVCDGYFADEKGINQYNPWYIPITADCVRPEGAPDCATINCLVCGEEIYGYGEHDLGENFACQGGTCLKCGTEVSGYGCANYDTPACMDGVCYYCGGFVAGLGHENGAWAPCMKGECSYGCGLEYPATAEHVDNEGDGYCDTCWSHLNHTFENGFDPCLGGECSVCWTYVAGEHEFDTEYTVDKAPTEEETGLKSRHCANCSEVTDVVEIPVIMRGDVNGDNRITSRDLMALKKFLQSVKSESFNEFNADINGDGRINSRDTIALKNKMA